MSLRDRFKQDHGLDVRIDRGSGTRGDPFVLDACGEADAALGQLHLLRCVGRGLGQLWRIVEWLPTELGSATEVIRVESVTFTETQIVTETRGVYFDTRAVDGSPRTRHPLQVWSGPGGVLTLPYELGWLHFDQSMDNAAAGEARFDQTVMFSGQGAKAAVYVYGPAAGDAVAEAEAEFERAAATAKAGGVEDPWGVFRVGPFAAKFLLTGPDMTVVALAVQGDHFVKVRLTHFDDRKMRELMRATLGALGDRMK
jgi:hypothetical protein